MDRRTRRKLDLSKPSDLNAIDEILMESDPEEDLSSVESMISEFVPSSSSSNKEDSIVLVLNPPKVYTSLQPAEELDYDGETNQSLSVLQTEESPIEINNNTSQQEQNVPSGGSGNVVEDPVTDSLPDQDSEVTAEEAYSGRKRG